MGAFPAPYIPLPRLLRLQLSKYYTTSIPTAGGATVQLRGLAGFHREVVKEFTKRCLICAAKRVTQPAQQPAVKAIVVKESFGTCQVSLHHEMALYVRL